MRERSRPSRAPGRYRRMAVFEEHDEEVDAFLSSSPVDARELREISLATASLELKNRSGGR